MNLALWFDVLVHVWNGDLWCCDDVNELVDIKKKKTKQKQSTICDQMEVCVWASGWSLYRIFHFSHRFQHILHGKLEKHKAQAQAGTRYTQL